jgi:MFS-type transporter involved in bile tolerance (Atg22 family)
LENPIDELVMKVIKAVLCLLIASVAFAFTPFIQGHRPDSWFSIEALTFVPMAFLFVGVLWLLVFLPLFFFTRRFGIWGWRKAGLLGCLLGFPLLALLGGRNEGEPLLLALISPAIYGVCVGLLFALGSIVTREGWQRKLGLTQLWILVIGGVVILVVPPKPNPA